MSEAPERIWAGMVTTQHYPLVIQRLWDVERFGDKTGYVRVDLYEQLQAEVEQLRDRDVNDEAYTSNLEAEVERLRKEVEEQINLRARLDGQLSPQEQR